MGLCALTKRPVACFALMIYDIQKHMLINSTGLLLLVRITRYFSDVLNYKYYGYFDASFRTGQIMENCSVEILAHHIIHGHT